MRARSREASWELWSRGLRSVEVKSGFAFPELLGSARAGEGGLSARPDFPALSC